VAYDKTYFTERVPNFLTPFIILSCLVAIGVILGVVFMMYGKSDNPRSLGEHLKNIVRSFHILAYLPLSFLVKRK
jgi:hypothetical protein